LVPDAVCFLIRERAAAGGASASGIWWLQGFVAEQNEQMALGDAPEGVEESRREERWRGSPAAANSAGDARSGYGFR
jgi:hypothetical protein